MHISFSAEEVAALAMRLMTYRFRNFMTQRDVARKFHNIPQQFISDLENRTFRTRTLLCRQRCVMINAWLDLVWDGVNVQPSENVIRVSLKQFFVL